MYFYVSLLMKLNRQNTAVC